MYRGLHEIKLVWIYLDQSGYRETESQGDLQDGRRIQPIDPHNTATADEHQNGRAHKLGEQHIPYLIVFGYVVHRDHTVYN